MAEIEILEVLLNAASLVGEITKLAGTPKPLAYTSDLDSKFRTIHCTIRNETQFSIDLNNTHFDSGRYSTAPSGVSSFSHMSFTGCNKDWSIGTGVSGGNSFTLQLGGGKYFNFALGWSNPTVGGLTAGVVESPNAYDGYNAGFANTDGGYIVSQNIYAGKEKDGTASKIQFRVSAAPGQETSFVVTQVRL